jgi:hypothetical protein
MAEAQGGNIFDFLIAVANGGVNLSTVAIGSVFIWKGLTFTKTAVTACALGIVAPLGLLLVGTAMVGAGIWLNYVNKK